MPRGIPSLSEVQKLEIIKRVTDRNVPRQLSDVVYISSSGHQLQCLECGN